MKLKKEKKDSKVDNSKKQKEIEKKTSIEVGNHGGNVMKKKKDTKKGTNGLDFVNVNKKKLKEAVKISKTVEDVKKTKKKKSAESILVKPIVSVKDSKKKVEKKIASLVPSMSSSELLRKLNSEISSLGAGSNYKKDAQTNKTEKLKLKKIEKSGENSKPLKKSKENSKNENDGISKKKIKKFGKADKVKKSKTNKIKKNKREISQTPVPSLEEAPEFDEYNFHSILNIDKIEKSVKVLKKLVKKETEEMKNTIFKDYRYMLNLGLFKIPSAPKRHVKLKVKHSLVGADDDVLFIVKDLQRGMKIDYEPTVHHYQDMLREHGIEGIKNIMPFNQLKKEYNSYEMKRKLSNLYDYFICDGRIVGHVFGFLGTALSSKQRCTLYPVRTEKPKHLKKEIEIALHKTSFKQGAKGDTISMIVGNDRSSPEEVAENIIVLLDQLKTKLSGGYPNIRNVTIKVNLKGTSSVPLYISMGKPPIETPYEIGTKEHKLNKLKERAEDILGKFTFTNDGSIEKISEEEIEARKNRKREAESSASSNKKNKKTKKAKLEKLEGKKELKDKKNEIEELNNLVPEDSESEDDPDFEPGAVEEDDDFSSGSGESDDDDDDDEEDNEEEGSADNDNDVSD